jgi:hypothetical protein
MLNKKSIVSSLGGLLCLAVCQIGAPSVAQADIVFPEDNTTGTMSAMAGFGWPNTAKDCFSNSWSLTRNSCTDTKVFLLPFQVSMAKPPNVASSLQTLVTRVRGYGSAVEQVTCKPIVNTINNGARFGSSVSTTGGSRNYQWLGYSAGEFYMDTSSVQMDVLGGEAAHLECSVPKDVGLVSVRYHYATW